jgi:ribosomal-protein-alanine N-acetyltransferase
MNQLAETFIIREMRLADVPQVVAIDRASFTLPWTAGHYEFEVSNRDSSHMVVLEAANLAPSGPNGLRGFLSRLLAPQSPATIVGYGGYWLIAGEVHISTIATHPDFRSRGLGELLLVGMLLRAIELGGAYSVLEVRESNLTAQRLYEKYEYKVVGRRNGYYRDNNEDALLMEVRPIDGGYITRLKQRLEALRERVTFVDQFTQPNAR